MPTSADFSTMSKANLDAMRDSDYFNKPKSSNPFSRGFNFLQDQISKLNKSDEDEDDDKLADYLKGKSYMPEKESSRDMLAKFILDRGLGGFGGGSTLTADSGNFSVRYPNQQQPQVIDPGSPASGGIQGAASGALQGFVASGLNPAGAIFGGLRGLLS